MSTHPSKDTLCIQAGYTPKVGEPRILPIVQSTTYKYDDIEQVNRLMTLQEVGFKYTRTGNPSIPAAPQLVPRNDGENPEWRKIEAAWRETELHQTSSTLTPLHFEDFIPAADNPLSKASDGKPVGLEAEKLTAETHPAGLPDRLRKSTGALGLN